MALYNSKFEIHLERRFSTILAVRIILNKDSPHFRRFFKQVRIFFKQVRIFFKQVRIFFKQVRILIKHVVRIFFKPMVRILVPHLQRELN